MRFLAAASLLLLAPAAAAAIGLPQAPPSSAGEGQAADGSRPIVVTGVRIQDYRDRLAACLARHCPVNEDVDASLALAEVMFLSGDYGEARSAIRGSLGRNRREAEHFPEPVSDLYRANARVSRHMGMDRDAQLSTWGILRALQAGLPQEDHRHFTARFEIVQSLIAFGRYNQARHELDELADHARAAGRDDVVASAELRKLWVSYLQAPSGSAQRELVALSATSDPRRSIGAKMLLVRIYGERREPARANALMAELGRGSSRRQLLHNPPFQLQVRDTAGDPEAVTQFGRAVDSTLARRPGNIADQWVDVGFWIQADGSVAGLEVVRNEGRSDWAAPLLESIRGRRYSSAADNQPTFRVERYTYTSGYELRAGSHIMQRSPRARVEYFDLGGEAENPPAASESR